jgi:hypothetical protein
MSPTLSDLDFDSIKAAIREEIAAAKESVRTAWLDIDGIEHLADASGNFVYRLLLSSTVHFISDQTVTFHTRNRLCNARSENANLVHIGSCLSSPNRHF